jgi:multicomponent Na+:H+ antiporter subunit G
MTALEILRDVLGWVFLIGGSVLSIAGGIGLLRFPDFYTRIHAGGLTDTGGAGLVMAGLLVQSDSLLVAVKLVIVLFFLLLTSPTATHALARAALTAGVKPLLASEPEEDDPSTT